MATTVLNTKIRINGSFGSPEKRFSINFSKANTKFCLILHYNADNSYLFVNGKTILKFKANNENFPTQFCFGSISNGFSAAESSFIYNRIRYLISLKSDIKYVFSHYYAKTKVDSYDSLPTEKRLILHNVVILIKSVLNKDQNHYYYKIFLEKCSYQLAKK